MANPIEVTGPHAGQQRAYGPQYTARCSICGAATYLQLHTPDAVEGDLADAIRDSFEGRSVSPPRTPAEVNVRQVAIETASAWRRDLASYGCTHCPQPVAAYVHA